MSFQIFLQGKILGTEEFLRSAANDIEGRAYWVLLLSEVAPRALLAELGLSAMLLGSSATMGCRVDDATMVLLCWSGRV